MKRQWLLSLFVLGLTACSAVKVPVTHQYQLTNFSGKVWSNHHSGKSILVTLPDAVAGYQTEQMVYVNKPYQLSAFAKNAWTAPPAEMLYPLIVQSLQRTNYFYAVASSPYAQVTNYRLDTQLLRLEQNFLRNPSVLELAAKVVLTRVSDNSVIGSRVISVTVPCPKNSPEGGVYAANQATIRLTSGITDFVISRLRKARAG